MGTTRRIFQAVFAIALGFTGCTVTTTNDQCSPDSTVVCSQGSGYSCTGQQTPVQNDATLNCSMGTMGNAGSTLFCCASASSGTCGPDPTVATCPAGSSGYSCTGSDTPPQTDSTLSCGMGSAGNAGSTIYCCTSGGSDGGTCSVDPNAANCTSGSTPYSCSGSATPLQGNPTALCSPGAPVDGGLTLFCCTGVTNLVDGGSDTGVDAGVEADADAGADGATDGAGDVVADGGDAGVVTDAGDGGTCSLGVDTGNPACDQCLMSQCCSQILACDTPDEAGVDDGGNSACEQLLSCYASCLTGNPDAGVPPGTLSSCQSLCDVPPYTQQEEQAASALVQCQIASCSQACQ